MFLIFLVHIIFLFRPAPITAGALVFSFKYLYEGCHEVYQKV